MKKGKVLLYLLISLIFMFSGGCRSVDDERIPSMPVYISLSDAGSWNVFGVFGFGDNRSFILTPSLRVPSNFPYTELSRTGFGGVLLIDGMDPFTTLTDTPLAYDLSCPVERKADIRVIIDENDYVAFCPECGSTYDVTMGGGSPLSGPAATGKYKYGLRSYKCLPSGYGGYVITN